MIANSFVLYAYLKCFLSVICGNLRIWVKSSSTCGNLAGAVWSNLSHSFSFFWDKALRVGDKKKIKMVTESLTVTNEKCRPEVGVELCDQCWREGLNVWHQGSRNMPLKLSMSPSPSQRTGSVSPVQTIRRFSRTLKLPLVLFTLAFCTSVWSLGLFSARSTQQRSRWTPWSWSPGSTELSRVRVGQSYWPRPEKTNISLRRVLCGFFPAHAIEKPVSGPTCTWDLSTAKCTHNKLLM